MCLSSRPTRVNCNTTQFLWLYLPGDPPVHLGGHGHIEISCALISNLAPIHAARPCRQGLHELLSMPKPFFGRLSHIEERQNSLVLLFLRTIFLCLPHRIYKMLAIRVNPFLANKLDQIVILARQDRARPPEPSKHRCAVNLDSRGEYCQSTR